jgi:hypothetical protein
MRQQVSIEELVRVAVRTLPSGKIAPKSFIWREQTHNVSAVGRQWAERTDGVRLRCFLVQTQDQNAFELHWNPAEDIWSLHRAWLQNLV